MYITKNILKNWIDIPEDVENITTKYITEVESFRKIEKINNLVIGKVLTCIDHPNSDHLHITTVDIKTEILQIVCGAKNVDKDQYVIVAKVGALLPGDFLIKEARIRDVESSGMICSLKELGIEDKYILDKYKEGIYVFDTIEEIGKDANEVLCIDDFIMELSLTPNRSDLLSIYGYANDLAAATNTSIKKRVIKFIESSDINDVKVKIETDGCHYYSVRKVTNVEIKESPWWLKSSLINSGIRPINNVVDISNYVLLEYGTPLHMFDKDKVKTNNIVIRNAYNEVVVTLDDIERKLNNNDVVITNGTEIIAIAGVMGLKNTMVDDNTTDLIVEAAVFDREVVSNTSKKLDLKSDSSLRFERGVDQQRVEMGLNRAMELLIELANAKVSKNVVSTKQHSTKMIKEDKKSEQESIIKLATQNTKVVNPEITIHKKYFTKKLGNSFNEEKVKDILTRLNYEIRIDDTNFIVKAPSYRNDILDKVDVLEEVVRIYGFDAIKPKGNKLEASGRLTKKQKYIRNIRHKLANIGFNEIITYSLLDRKDVKKYADCGESVEILMPLSDDKNTLRQSLLNGLLETISYNQARKQTDLAFFEIGSSYTKELETTKLSLGMTGTWIENSWTKNKIEIDFFLLKGILDNIFDNKLKYAKSSKIKYLHPNKQADILLNNEVIGVIAELNPQEASILGIKKTCVCEIDLEKIMNIENAFEYMQVNKFPTIKRDISIVIKKEISVSDIMDLIMQTGKKMITNIELFDVYSDDNLGKDLHSLAFSMTFSDNQKTLVSEDVDKIMKSIINRLNFNFQAEIRS